ncbi:MAG: membrane protein insertion efficiency factor YidD [bacterium]
MKITARNNIQRLSLASLCAVCQWIATVTYAGNMEGPWSVNSQFPVPVTHMSVSPMVSVKDVPDEMGRSCSYTWLKIYQNYFSVVLTSHCPMYPSCSNYSIQAIRRYGSLKGIMMTADRLIHESTEMREAPVIQIGGRALSFDPAEYKR